MSSYAQTELGLFTTITRSSLELNNFQSEKLDRMIQNPIYSNYYFVSVNNVAQIQQEGVVTVNLPDKNYTIQYLPKNVKYKSNLDFSYHGEINDCDDRMGYLTLIAKNGNLFGQVNIENETYEIVDLGNKKHVLFKINSNVLASKKCGDVLDSSGIKNKGSLEANLRHAGCKVRVLVMYTDAAKRVANPFDKAVLSIAQSNQAAINSDATVNFELVGVERLPNFQELPDFVLTTRDNFRGNFFVQNRRNATNADIVLLFTDGNFFDGTIGISYLDHFTEANFGYVMVEIDAANASLSFTHELAHDLGCQHENPNTVLTVPPFNGTARAHTFFTGIFGTNLRKTIMRFNGSVDPICHFSNPDVKFKGKRTGNAVANNAQQLASGSCIVAAYRPEPIPPFGVTISGPEEGNNSTLYTWCANVVTCPNVFSYKWEYSLDGFNYYLATNTSICFTSYLPYDHHVYYRVTATCSNGDIATDVYYVFNKNDKHSPRFKPCDISSIASKVNPNTNGNISFLAPDINLSTFPVPFGNELNIKYELLDEKEVILSIENIFGQRIQLINKGVQSKGIKNETVNKASFQSGFYIVKLEIDGKVLSNKIAKL